LLTIFNRQLLLEEDWWINFWKKNEPKRIERDTVR